MTTLDNLKTHLIITYGLSTHDYTDSYLHLNNDLGLDSLDRIELLNYVEKTYNLKINDYQAEDIETLNQLADYIDNRKCTCFTNAQKKLCKRNMEGCV